MKGGFIYVHVYTHCYDLQIQQHRELMFLRGGRGRFGHTDKNALHSQQNYSKYADFMHSLCILI